MDVTKRTLLMAVGVSMVMLADDSSPDPVKLKSFLQKSYPDLPEVERIEVKDITVAFKLGAADVVLGKMPAPIPWSDLQGPCTTSILWGNAAEEIQAHKTHIIVAVSGNLTAFDRSKLLTQATASVLASCPSALGVYWGNATLVVPKALFVDFATTILPKGPPVHIWVDTRVGRKGTESAGFTTGLDALGHMEIETNACPEEPGALRERLYQIAEYLIESGRTIDDGDTIGDDTNEKIRVVYADSAFGITKKVMKLVYEKPSVKSKWKLW